MKVLNIDQTLDYVLAHHSSVARFGDGEVEIMHGHPIAYQEANEELAKRLRSLMKRKSDEHLVVCLSDVFENRERYNDYARYFWEKHLNDYHDFYQPIIELDQWYGSTFISRPYIDLVDKSLSAGYFTKLKQLWNQRDILIVEGKNSRSGVGNDLFDNAKSVQRIICPPNNAWRKVDQIEDAIRQAADQRLVLLMLGPTAKVIVEDLTDENVGQLIDIGHIDSEYEWFKMGATSKVKLSNKHTAEFNYDQDIVLADDEQYQAQIIADLTD